MNFRTVEEARRRALIIALLTYSIMRGPNLHVKMFTAALLVDSESLMQNVLSLWKLYGISQNDPDNYVTTMGK